MSIAERPAQEAGDEHERPSSYYVAPPPSGESAFTADRLWWGLAVGLLLLFAFGLRVWGVDHGLPYAYNSDENAHFVTRAIGLFGHGWDPQYYVNPPAYTYLAHALLGAWYGGRQGVADAFAADPTQIWVLARLLAAVLGTLAIWL